MPDGSLGQLGALLLQSITLSPLNLNFCLGLCLLQPRNIDIHVLVSYGSEIW